MRQDTLDFTFASTQGANRTARIAKVSAGSSYSHYALLFGGNVYQETERNGVPVGPAFMQFKCWASSQDQAMKLGELFSKEFSYTPTGVQFLEGEPEKPPCAIPFGYDFRIMPSKFAAMIC